MKRKLHYCLFAIELGALIAGVLCMVVSRLPMRMNLVTDGPSEFSFAFADGQKTTRSITYGQLYYATNSVAKRVAITFRNAKDGNFNLIIPKPFTQFELYFNFENSVQLPEEILFKSIMLNGSHISLEDQRWEAGNDKIHFKCFAYKPKPVLRGYLKETILYGCIAYLFGMLIVFIGLHKLD